MQTADRHGPGGGRKRARRLGLPALVALPIVVAFGLVAALGAAAKGTQGNPAAGKTIFKANCAVCHTLSAAGATGTIGPNLDTVKLSQAQIEDQVTHGGTTILGPAAAKKYPAPMPPFKGVLSKAQIENVAAFVYVAQHPGAKTAAAAPAKKKPAPKKTAPKKKAAPAPTAKPSTKKKTAAAAPAPTTKKAAAAAAAPKTAPTTKKAAAAPSPAAQKNAKPWKQKKTAAAPSPAPPKSGKAPGFTS